MLTRRRFIRITLGALRKLALPQIDAFFKQECKNHDYASENKLSLSLHLQVQDQSTHACTAHIQVHNVVQQRRETGVSCVMNRLDARTFLRYATCAQRVTTRAASAE
jgi:hypothetical protein